MEVREAIALISPAIKHRSGTWADIGAGTGMFTSALLNILSGGQVIALDKSPHALWKLENPGNVQLEIREGDFNHPLDLPPLDGIVMANALHYARDHSAVLKNVIRPLRAGGILILVEYDTNTPQPPWVPYPISFQVFTELSERVGMGTPELLASIPSRYGHSEIYAATCTKSGQD